MKVLAYKIELPGMTQRVKDANDLAKALNRIGASAKKIKGGDSFERLNRQMKNMSTLQSQFTQNTKRSSIAATQNANKMLTLGQEVSRAKRQLEQLHRVGQENTVQAQQLRDRIAQLSVIQRQVRDDTRLATNAKLAEEKSYRGLAARLIVVRKEYKDLLATQASGTKLTRQQTKELDRLEKEYRQLDSAVKKVDASAGQYQRNVGNYSSAFKNFGRNIVGALGIGTAATVFIGAMRDAGRVVVEFDSTMAELASITGMTREELVLLEQQAIDLGGSTVFTASQVGKLQTDLARLGFTEEEIIDSTESVINLSVALGVEANRGAQLIGAAINQFNLSAEEAARVASVLAVSTTRSALNFEKLEVSMRQVAPVAAAYGFTIEETVGFLGKLADAGFDASQAGTAFRNILLNLADTSGGLAQELGGNVESFDQLIPALQKLKEEGIDLNSTLQLTDKRSVAAFRVLLEGSDDVNELTESITDVNEELQVMVDKQLDTVAGDMKLLRSAWEGFILSVEKGDGAISKFTRGTLQKLTNDLSLLQHINQGNITVWESLKAGVSEASFMDIITGKWVDYSKAVDIANKRVEEQDAKLEDFKNNINDLVNGAAVPVERAATLTKFYREQLELTAKGSEEYGEAKQKLMIAEKALDRVSKAAQETQAEGSTIDEKRAKTVAELKKEIKELREQQEQTIPNGQRYLELQAKIDSINNKLGKSSKEVASGYKVVEGSLSDLRNTLSELERQYAATNDEALLEQIEEATKALSVAEKRYQEFKDAIDKEPEMTVAELRAEIERLKGEISTPGDLKLFDSYLEKLKEIEEQQERMAFIRSDRPDPIAPLGSQDDNVSTDSDSFGQLKPIKLRGAFEFNDEEILAQAERQIASIYDQLVSRLSTESLSAKDRESLIAETEEKVLQIRQEADIKALQYRLDNEKLTGEERIALQQELAQKEIEIENEKVRKVIEMNKEMRQLIAQNSIALAENSIRTILQMELSKIDRAEQQELDSLDRNTQRELAAAEGNSQLQEAIKADAEEKKLEIERKYAQERKAFAKKEAIIQGALAIIKAWVNPGFPAALALTGFIAAQTALQIAAIEGQQFREGDLIPGKDSNNYGLLRGPSHEAGGIKAVVRPTGQFLELEGEEFVTRRSAVKDPTRYKYEGTNLEVLRQMNKRRSRDYAAPVRKMRLGGQIAGTPAQQTFTVSDQLTSVLLKSAELIMNAADNINETMVDVPESIYDASRSGAMEGAKVGTATGLGDANRRLERERIADENSTK